MKKANAVTYRNTKSGVRANYDAVNTYVEDEMLDEKGQINYERLKPVLFEMPTHKYLATGKVLGDAVKMGRTFKGE